MGNVIYLERRKGPGRRKRDRIKCEMQRAIEDINEKLERQEITGVAFVVFTEEGYRYGVYGSAASSPAQTAGHLLRLSSKINDDLL